MATTFWLGVKPIYLVERIDKARHLQVTGEKLQLVVISLEKPQNLSEKFEFECTHGFLDTPSNKLIECPEQDPVATGVLSVLLQSRPCTL